jgi:c-di-GMP-binding flagellar brake protein YcgR
MSELSAEPTTIATPPPAGIMSDESQYLLHARIDIAAVLRDIVRARSLASVHFGSDDETLLTPLLAVSAAAGEVTFDCSGSAKLNEGILRAHKLLFFCAHDKVKVRFSTGPAQLAEHQGRQAFTVQFPASMLRLQRREYYRVLTPVTRPVRCVIPVDEQDGIRYAETRLHDISQGGVALIADPGELPAKVGARYLNCRIVLPQAGNVVVTLETAYMLDVTLLNGKAVTRAGCQFIRPSLSALSLVQRYMMKLERENKARD